VRTSCTNSPDLRGARSGRGSANPHPPDVDDHASVGQGRSVFWRPAGHPWCERTAHPTIPAHGLKAGAMLEPKAAASLFEGAWHHLGADFWTKRTRRGRSEGQGLLKSTGGDRCHHQGRRYSSPDVIGVIEGSDSKAQGRIRGVDGTRRSHRREARRQRGIGSTTVHSTTRRVRPPCSRWRGC
jgi:hypothetical protein